MDSAISCFDNTLKKMKLFPHIQKKHGDLKSLFLFLIFAVLTITGCGNSGTTSEGETSRNIRDRIAPQITSARLIDAQGNDIETQLIDGNTIITPKDGQRIGFEISFLAAKDVSVEVIVNQYTPMDLNPEPEESFCEGFGCPAPDKGEIPYSGEEIFYEFGNNNLFPISPFDGPRRYTIPSDIEPDIVVTEDQFTEVETETHKEYFLQIKTYYTIAGPGYERMFRFQVEDSEGYVSKDHIIYTNIPL
jgi:hypothetical protein